MARSSKPEPRLRTAVEIAGDRVVAARANASGNIIEAVSVRTLPAGVVTPNLSAENVHDIQTVSNAVRDALDAVGARQREVSLIMPDASSRIALLDFDTLPERRQDAEGIVRFRLKKSLPFDVDRAAVSYETQSNNGKIRVVAAVAQQSVLNEYESVVREAGRTPGMVLPAVVAALGTVDTSRPRLVLNVEPGTTTLVIVDQDELLLYRNLEYAGAPRAEQLADDVYPSVVFFEDTYGMKIDRILVGGIPLETVASALEEASGVRVQELVGASVFGPAADSGAQRERLAGVVGALIG